MGGYGSGRGFGYSPTLKLNDGFKIKLSDFRKKKVLKKGLFASGSSNWGESTISFELDTRDKDDMWLRLKYNKTYNGERYSRDYKVKLVTTIPNYGGERYWFICPVMGRKTNVLYSTGCSKYFASRHAYNLKYNSQSEDAYSRALTKRDRLECKLESKRMHTKTHEKLSYALMHAEYRCNVMLLNKFGYSL